VDSRNAALVAAVLHTFANSLWYRIGWQHLGSHGKLGRRVREAKDVGVENRLGTKSGAENVTIDAQNAGQGSTVRLQCRGRIMRFHFEADGPIVIPLHDTGVVVKDGQQVWAPFFQLLGGSLDICFVQAAYCDSAWLRLETAGSLRLRPFVSALCF